MSILDLVLLVLLVLAMAIGWFRGFVRVVFSLVTGVAAFLGAMLFAAPVARLLRAFGLLAGLPERIAERISAFPTPADYIEETLHLPGGMTDALLSSVTGGTGLPTALEVGERIRLMALNAIATVVIFVGILVVFALLSATLDKIVRHTPGVRTVNSVLGMAAGLAEALVGIFVLLALAALLSPFLGSVTDAIRDSVLLSVLYDLNPLLLILPFG